jgi:membrane dipeptidase
VTPFAISDEARKLHEQSLVCDVLFPWEDVYIPAGADIHKVLDRYRKAGANYVSITVTSIEAGYHAFLKVAAMRNIILREPSRYLLVESADDILAAQASGKLAIALHFQGTNPFEMNLDLIEAFYRLGIRHALMVYNVKNFVGDGCHERTDSGLSRMGQLVVKEMNRVGMIVDVTHTGYRTSMEAMELSSAPPMFSHSNPRALYDHDRNITDDQIRLCASKGGLICLNGVGMFLGSDVTPENLVERMLRHIDYVVQLVGAGHVGLGSDFMYLEGSNYGFYYKYKFAFPKGYPDPPWHFLQPDQLPQLTEGMLRMGYPVDAIRGILGENFLRLARAVWK